MPKRVYRRKLAVIVEVLSSIESTHMYTAQIARRCRLKHSRCRRVLMALEEHGWVKRCAYLGPFVFFVCTDEGRGALRCAEKLTELEVNV